MKTKAFLISLLFVTNACLKDNAKLPTVTTSPITEVTWDYAIAGGEVIDDGGSQVTARGICVTTSSTDLPTIIDNWNTWHTSDSSGIGSFTSTTPFVYAGAAHNLRQTHYFRAYATNIAGTAYGEVISVDPNSKPPTFISIKLIELTSTTATIECTIGEVGSHFDIDEFYFCYGSNPNPTIEGTHSIPQQVPDWGSYFQVLNLLPNTSYYLRGYVKNESGFAYSPEISFTTLN